MRAPCEIRHIDLSRTIEPLVLADGHETLLAVFWWRTVPLGQRLFDGGELPLPAAALADLAAQVCVPAVYGHLLDDQTVAPGPELLCHLMRLEALLAALDRRLGRQALETIELKASIIIRTCDRPEAVVRCLASLEPSRPYIHEIIVVENGSGVPGTRDVVAAVPNAIYVREPRPGGSIARNTGAQAASGGVLAFIDDDVVAHDDWVPRLLTEFEDPTITCVTGLILPFELATDAQIAFETHFGFGRGFAFITYDDVFFAENRKKGVPVWRLGGGNMALRRDVFLAIGGYDERLGPGGDAAGCAEDSELWYRLLAAGLKCRYTPAAVVYHEHRREMAALQCQLHNYMRGHVVALLIQFEKHGHWGNIYRMLISLPHAYMMRLLAGHRRVTLLAEITGYLAGAVFYVRCRLRGRSRNETGTDVGNDGNRCARSSV